MSKVTRSWLFFLKFFYLLFIYYFYFWLCWVFVSVRGLSPVAASGGHSSSRCAVLSPPQPLLLRSRVSRRSGSAVVAHGPSCSAACGILPDQGSNPCPLHWQADSQPLRHQGSPLSYFLLLLRLYLSTLLGKVTSSLTNLITSSQQESYSISIWCATLCPTPVVKFFPPLYWGPLSGLFVLCPAVALSYVLGLFLFTLCTLPWKAHPFSCSPSLWSHRTYRHVSLNCPLSSRTQSPSVWQVSPPWLSC